MVLNARSRKRARRNRVRSATTSNIQHAAFTGGSTSTYSTLDRKALSGQTVKFNRPPNNNDTIGAAPAMAFIMNGFKICCTLRNNVNEPIHVHMALIQPKQENATISDIRSNFFRDPHDANDKNHDFIESTSVAAWDRQQDCNPMNRNKFNIFTHKKFLLQGKVPTDHNDNKASFVHFEQYYPVKKRFEYETTTSTDVKNPIWILIWYETLFPNSSIALNALQYNVRTVCYTANRN